MAHSKFTLDLRVADVTKKNFKVSSAPVNKLLLNWSILARVQNNTAGIKYLSVHLSCESEGNQTWGCRIKDKFILKNQNSQPLMDFVESDPDSGDFKNGVTSLGYNEFYEFDDLVNKDNGFILNDGIWIQIEVSPETPSGIHYDEKMAIQGKFRFDTAATSTVNMLYLLQSGEGSNVTLVSRDKVELKVHRGILTMKSEVFGPMLAAEMKEGRTGVVNIADMDGSSIKMFLRFLYSGDLSMLEESSLKEVKQLINAAEKYGLPELKTYCSYLLVERCQPKNAPKLYLFAHKYGLEESAQEIFKFVEGNFKDFWDKLLKNKVKVEESTFDTDSSSSESESD